MPTTPSERRCRLPVSAPPRFPASPHPPRGTKIPAQTALVNGGDVVDHHIQALEYGVKVDARGARAAPRSSIARICQTKSWTTTCLKVREFMVPVCTCRCYPESVSLSDRQRPPTEPITRAHGSVSQAVTGGGNRGPRSAASRKRPGVSDARISYPRKRSATACHLCRLRKVRL